MNVLYRPPITPDEFEQMSGMEGHELIDGEPQEKPMGLESSWVQSQIGHLLRQWVVGGNHGWVFDAEGGYICFPHRPNLVRKPDASFVRRGRFKDDRVPRGYARLVPDLAVEVVSPNDTCNELEGKISDYLRVSVPMLWVAYPSVRSLYVFRAGGPNHRLTDEDELSGESVLPGFRVKVADLFPPPAPQSAESAADETQP
jgi:Uma2 family endonuclease